MKIEQRIFIVLISTSKIKHIENYLIYFILFFPNVLTTGPQNECHPEYINNILSLVYPINVLFFIINFCKMRIVLSRCVIKVKEMTENTKIIFILNLNVNVALHAFTLYIFNKVISYVTKLRSTSQEKTKVLFKGPIFSYSMLSVKACVR